TPAPRPAAHTARLASLSLQYPACRTADPASRTLPMRKRTIIRDVRNAIPDKAFDIAGRIGDGFRNAVPDNAGKWLHDAPSSAGKWLQGVPEGAGKWLQAG